MRACECERVMYGCDEVRVLDEGWMYGGIVMR